MVRFPTVRHPGFSIPSLMAACIIVSTSAIAGDVFNVVITGKESQLQSTLRVEADLPGFLIGNYHPVENPTGTMTRPGTFGGSGNMPINFDSTGISEGEIDGAPDGVFRLCLDHETDTARISGLTLDLLSGSTPTFDLVLEVLFQTFRTFQPNSLFIGGIPFEFPLGQMVVTRLEATQVGGPAVGTLIDLGGGTYQIVVGVTVEVLMEAEFNEEPVELEPFLLELPVTAQVTVTGNGLVLEGESEWELDELFKGPFEGVGLDAFPVDVPTVLPPGATAHLLITNQLESVHMLYSGSLLLRGLGSSAPHEPSLADTFARVRGLPVSGDLGSLHEDDDNRLVTRPDVFRTSAVPPVQVMVETVCPIQHVCDLRFLIESRASVNNIMQRVLLFDHVGETWVIVDSRSMTTTDRLLEITPLGDPSRFVNVETGRIRALIQCNALAFTIAPTWTSQIDRVGWLVR